MIPRIHYSDVTPAPREHEEVAFFRHDRCGTKVQITDQGSTDGAWCPSCRHSVEPLACTRVSFVNPRVGLISRP